MNDDILAVRTSAAWAFYKFSMNRNGCDIMVETGSADAIVDSLMFFSDPENIHEDSGKYLIYLLESLCNFTNYDHGIEPLLGKDCIACLNYIISSDEIDKLGPFKQRIQELSLRVLGNVALNHSGK